MIPPAIFLDLDGTILDSEPMILQSWKIAHEQTCPDIKWNKTKLLSLMGQPAEAIPFGMGISLELHPKYLQIFDQQMEKLEFPLFDDVKPVLTKIKEKSIPLCIITGAKTDETLQLLIQNKIQRFFTEIIGADLTKRGKPYPDPINLAIERLNLNLRRREIIFVGDSINDMKSARAAGVISTLIWRKTSEIPNNIKQIADLIIPSFEVLLDLLE